MRLCSTIHFILKIRVSEIGARQNRMWNQHTHKCYTSVSCKRSASVCIHLPHKSGVWAFIQFTWQLFFTSKRSKLLSLQHKDRDYLSNIINHIKYFYDVLIINVRQKFGQPNRIFNDNEIDNNDNSDLNVHHFVTKGGVVTACCVQAHPCAS